MISLRAWFTTVAVKEGDSRRRRAPGFSFVISRTILLAVAFSIGLVGCFRWAAPPTSAVMIGKHLERFFSGRQESAIRYQWVDWGAISPHMYLAAVAAEDQMFPHHRGFDFESMRKAFEASRRGDRLRGASTISQQVAKNLFLWTGRSYVRKGLEAYFTILLESLWSKRRILEVYLNIVEFGDGVYGIGAAAETFFRKKPGALTSGEAALLAAVLPNPKRFHVRNPSAYVSQRRYWVQRQMERLGGFGHLKDL